MPRKTAATRAPVKSRRPSPPADVAASAPTADLVTLAGAIPAELLQQLAAAIRSGQWLFAVWHIAAGQIRLERTIANFPTADIDKAVQLLGENLQPLKF